MSIRIIFIIIIVAGISCKKHEKSISGFTIEPGYELTLIAQEPLLSDPVDIEFGDNGEMYVLEMPGYPKEDTQSKIALLIDKNKDGVFDERNLFAENLNMASSILEYKNGILVAAPPYLLYIEDTNSDGKADHTDTLMGGFSTGNLQHNYNGLIYGLDGWIYAANGGNSGAPYWWNDTTTRLPLRGQDIRIHIQKKKLERIGESSGGFGLAIDDYGRLFETHNMEHVSHLIFPDRFIGNARLGIDHTLANISDHEENGTARIYPIGEQESRVNHPEQSGYFSGSCGIAYNGGNNLGDKVNNTIWVADVVLNLLHIDNITKDGSSLKASRTFDKRDFLASSDRAHRPVNIKLGYDGAMYVVDMYRTVIEHPEWIPDDLESAMNLDAGKEKGRIYKITKTGNKYDIPDFKNENLITLLGHKNQAVRMRAQHKLSNLNLTENEIKLVWSKIQNGTDHEQLHAAWLLSNKNILDQKFIVNLLHHKNPALVENALLMTEQYLTGEKTPDFIIVLQVIKLLNHPDQRVRVYAALVLSILTENQAPQFQNGMIDTLYNSKDLPQDKYNIAAITLANRHDPVPLFTKLILDNTYKQRDLTASLAGQSTKNGHHLESILKILSTVDLSRRNSSILQSIIKYADPSLQTDGIKKAIADLETSGDVNNLIHLDQLRKKLKLASSPQYLSLTQSAITNLQKADLTDSDIMNQLQLVSSLTIKEQVPVLLKYTSHTYSNEVQEKALELLNNLKDPVVGKELIKLWNTLAPRSRAHAGNLLLYNKIHHDALLTGLENKTINIGEMNFDLERRRTLLWWSGNDEIKKRAAKLFKDSGVTNRQDALDKMKPALSLVGNIQNGKIVFTNLCSSCHTYGSSGNEVGPALTEISRKSKETLLHDILDPNAAADTKYISHKIETKNGDIHIGIVSGESNFTVTIKKMGGQSITIDKSEIKTFQSLGTSLMMEGLEGNMSQQEMADLMEYLKEGK